MCVRHVSLDEPVTKTIPRSHDTAVATRSRTVWGRLPTSHPTFLRRRTVLVAVTVGPSEPGPAGPKRGSASRVPGPYPLFVCLDWQH